MIKKILFSFFLFCNIIFCNGQSSDSIFIWQGFEHNWSYNHRINRIGNYLDRDKHEIIYTAASGLGADSTYYSSKYLLLTHSEFDSYNGITTFKLEGKEGKEITAYAEIELDLELSEINKNTHVLLNGFDLTSIKKADKFEYFDIHVSQRPSRNLHKIIIGIEVKLKANCSTIECQLFNQKVAYTLDVHYLILRTDKNDSNSIKKTFKKEIVWDKETEIQHQNPKGTIKGKKDFEQGLLGIHQFSLAFNKEHWLMHWYNQIGDGAYDIETGSMDFQLKLSFKEWAANMKKESAYPKHSRFSKRGEGEVTLSMGITLVQFNEGKLKTIPIEGEMFWRGRNQSANSDAAISSKPLPL